MRKELRRFLINLLFPLSQDNKGPSSQGYGFSSGHVWIWELDYEEGWVLKNWCFWTDVKSWFIWKDPDAGKDWGQEEKGMTEDEMVGCHHWLDGHGFGWTPGVGYGQGGIACCDSWGCKELDTTEQLNWTELFQDKQQCWIKSKVIKQWHSQVQKQDQNVHESKMKQKNKMVDRADIKGFLAPCLEVSKD